MTLSDVTQIVAFLFILLYPWEAWFLTPLNSFLEWIDEDYL